jgi:hypothetical protein
LSWTHRALTVGNGNMRQSADPLSLQLRVDIRLVAELTSDPRLLALADLAEVPVALDHLRGLDPETRIVIRSELCYEADEGARVTRGREQRPALATVMPDGTVIAGDAFPAPPRQSPADPPGAAART